VIVTHDVPRLKRQVLLDLPDIDSHWAEHVEVTRRMLRHMLFPVWVQSVEKYADLQPQKLLAVVAEGNDPANFIFCLNKVDQVSKEAMAELRDDCAARIARAVGQASPPKVYLISAIKPKLFDLPALREKLTQQKPAAAVKQSIELAGKQRERSMLSWLDAQRLPERVQRLARLQRDAEDLIAGRLSTPLMETVIPRLLDDPAHRASIVDEVMNARVARWPIVNVLHTLLAPVTSLWRQNVGAAATPAGLVDAVVAINGRGVSEVVQATFALLQQTHPLVSPLYRQQRLWEAAPADSASETLRQSLSTALSGQRAEAVSRIARRGIIAPLVRWTLTIGAVLWFPIVQPVVELMLRDTMVQSTRGALLLAVQLLSATYLLKSAAFLGIWFLVLWLILRWDTQRRLIKLLTRWRGLDGEGTTFNTSVAALGWSDELLDPIRAAREREESLVQRADEMREQFAKPAA
jgi:hypothetical protein